MHTHTHTHERWTQPAQHHYHLFHLKPDLTSEEWMRVWNRGTLNSCWQVICKYLATEQTLVRPAFRRIINMWLRGALPQAPSLAWELFNVTLDKIVGCGLRDQLLGLDCCPYDPGPDKHRNTILHALLLNQSIWLAFWLDCSSQNIRSEQPVWWGCSSHSQRCSIRDDNI